MSDVTPRPPMSETVKPLTVEKIDEYRGLVEFGGHVGVGGKALASILDSHEALRARAEKAERDLAQSRANVKSLEEYIATTGSAP